MARSTPSLLYLVPDLFGPPGGIARYCRMVAQALVAGGVPPHIVALHDKSPTPAHPYASYYACTSNKIAFVRTVISQFVRTRPSLVLVGHGHFAPLTALLCKATRTPYIAFLYGIEVWEPLSGSRRWSLNAADLRLAISRHTATRAAATNGLSAAQSEILYNCLDPLLAPPAPRVNTAANPTILTVSRLSREDSYKGLDVVLKGLPTLLAEFPTLTYHIVGDGNARKDLTQLAATLQVSHAVRFHGTVSDDHLRSLYAKSDIYVMPSLNEGFGFVFLEAMAQGTPAIGGTLDATPEVIVDGVTGRTVDPHSPAAVADATAALLRDTALRQRMGEAALRHAHETFGFATFQQQLWHYLSRFGIHPTPAPNSSPVSIA
jgi:phosphatidylinositol alpha-1,6-mannosyltransferase